MPAASPSKPGTPAQPPSRLAAHRARMRASGLRVLQLWVPDTAQPAFAAQCKRQSVLAAEADEAEGVLPWLDAALNDLA
jgi:hypothetical protein